MKYTRLCMLASLLFIAATSVIAQTQHISVSAPFYQMDQTLSDEAVTPNISQPTAEINNGAQGAEAIMKTLITKVEAMSRGMTTSSIDTISGRITSLVERCLTRQGLHAYIIPSADNQNFTITADFTPSSTAQPSIKGTLTVTPSSVASQCSPHALLEREIDIGPGGVALSCRRLPTETVVVLVNTPSDIGMSTHFTYDAFVIPSPVVRFDATPGQIDRGQTATLSWEVRNARNVSMGDLGPVLATGNRSVAPTETTEYRLSVTSLDGHVQTAPRTITVIQPPAPPPTLSSARVFFRTTDDDKDGDTNIVVNMECSSGTIATVWGSLVTGTTIAITGPSA